MEKFYAFIFACFALCSVYAEEYPEIEGNDRLFIDAKNCRKLTDDKYFCRMRGQSNPSNVLIYDLKNKVESKMYVGSENQPHSFYQYQCDEIKFGTLDGDSVLYCRSSTRRLELLCFSDDNRLTLFDEDRVETFRGSVFWNDRNKCRELFQIVKNRQQGHISKEFLDSLNMKK